MIFLLLLLRRRKVPRRLYPSRLSPSRLKERKRQMRRLSLRLRLKYLVRLPAEIEDPREIEDFVIEVRDGEPIYVRDVAYVEYGFEEESTLSRVDRNPSVTLTVEKAHRLQLDRRRR